jgi:hypothetical protein
MKNFKCVCASILGGILLFAVGLASESAKVPSNVNKTLFEKQIGSHRTLINAAQNEEINWQVISAGGTKSSSASYRLNGTIGQTAVGYSTSTAYGLSHGFWQEFNIGGCCLWMRGNVDGDSSDQINVADLTYLVESLFKGGPPPPCIEEGNVNGDPNEDINVADLTYMVDFLFRGGPFPPPCP